MSASVAAPEVTVAVPKSEGAPPARSARAPRYRTDPSPWRREHAMLSAVFAAVGIAVLLGCWIGVSAELAWRDQIGWLVGACLGTGAVVLGGALWLMVGFREVRRGIRQLRADQRRAFDLPVPGARAEAATGPVVVATWVTAPGMTRVHRPDCLLMRGKPASEVPAAQLERYERCGVCSG